MNAHTSDRIEPFHFLPVAFGSIAPSLPFIQSGEFKAIAVSGPDRVPQLPGVKKMTEQGVPFMKTSEQFAEAVCNDLRGWGAIIKAANIRAE